MKKYAPQFCLSPLILAAAISLACGSSSGGPTNLTSISISPATANAQDYPNGQVQFTAVGYESGSSSPVSISPTWSVCNEANAQSEIKVNATGVAQCNAGASGTYIVNASVLTHSNPTCNVVLACSEAGTDCFGTHGVAELTCP
ncbi:MAG: hypothetical protein WA252_03885 [Candidatus Sulfotelmatobacter sp.]